MKVKFVAILTLVALSCQKEKAPVQQSNSPTLIDKAVDSPAKTVEGNVKSNTFMSNVENVVQISYSNSLLTQLKRSREWKRITTSYTLDLSDIKRAFLFTSPLTVITFKIKGKPQYFNVYIDKNNTGKFLITKMLQIANPETGLTTYRVESPDGVFYYKLDLNQKNQIGNWKFGTSMPADVFSQQDPPLSINSRIA